MVWFAKPDPINDLITYNFMTCPPVHIRPNVCYFFTVVNLVPFSRLYLNFAFVSIIFAAELPVYIHWFCKALNWVVARFLVWSLFRNQKLLDRIIVGSAINQRPLAVLYAAISSWHCGTSSARYSISDSGPWPCRRIRYLQLWVFFLPGPRLWPTTLSTIYYSILGRIWSWWSSAGNGICFPKKKLASLSNSGAGGFSRWWFGLMWARCTDTSRVSLVRRTRYTTGDSREQIIQGRCHGNSSFWIWIICTLEGSVYQYLLSRFENRILRKFFIVSRLFCCTFC